MFARVTQWPGPPGELTEQREGGARRRGVGRLTGQGEVGLVEAERVANRDRVELAENQPELPHLTRWFDAISSREAFKMHVSSIPLS